jgi:putative transposase
MTDHLPERKPSLRLGGWNYADAAWYYVTICTHEKHLLFGTIDNELIHLNDIGLLVHQHWLDIPRFHLNTILDEFIIMPNHIHGLIYLNDSVKTPSVGLPLSGNRSRVSNRSPSDRPTKKKSLSKIINQFKSFASREINRRFGELGESIWQRGFYDEVVRSDARLNQIRRYIRDNPKHWVHGPGYWK